MKSVAIAEAKAKFSSLVDEVRTSRKDIEIRRRDQPAVYVEDGRFALLNLKFAANRGCAGSMRRCARSAPVRSSPPAPRSNGRTAMGCGKGSRR